MYVHISSNIILSLSHIPMNIPLSLPFFMVSSTFVKACSDRLIDKLDGWWQSIYPHILYYFFCIFDMILSPYFSIFEISSYPPWYHHTSWPFLDQLPYFLVNHNISPYFTIFLSPMIYIYIYRLKHHIFLTGDQVLCHIRCSLALELGVHRAEDEWSQKWIGGAFFIYFQHFETFEY